MSDLPAKALHLLMLLHFVLRVFRSFFFENLNNYLNFNTKGRKLGRVDLYLLFSSPPPAPRSGALKFSMTMTTRHACTGMIESRGPGNENYVESFMDVSRIHWIIIYGNYKNIAADVSRYKVLNRLLNSRCILKALFEESLNDMAQDRFASNILPIITNIRELYLNYIGNYVLQFGLTTLLFIQCDEHNKEQTKNKIIYASAIMSKKYKQYIHVCII